MERPKRMIELIDDLIDQMIMDNVDFADDILREAGYDPIEVGKWGAEIARRASERSESAQDSPNSSATSETDDCA